MVLYRYNENLNFFRLSHAFKYNPAACTKMTCASSLICLRYMKYYKYTGLEISGVATQNANHFWGKCESL